MNKMFMYYETYYRNCVYKSSEISVEFMQDKPGGNRHLQFQNTRSEDEMVMFIRAADYSYFK